MLNQRAHYSSLLARLNKLTPNAFTLVELLIYVAIIGGVASTFILYTLSIAQSRAKTYVAEEVQSNTSMAIELIGQRIRTASGVNLGDSVFDVHPGRLSLTMLDAQKNPTVIDIDANGALQIKEGLAGSYVPITSSKVQATNLVFTNLSGGSSRENIRVDISVAYNNSSGDVEYNYSQSTHTAVSVRQ